MPSLKQIKSGSKIIRKLIKNVTPLKTKQLEMTH